MSKLIHATLLRLKKNWLFWFILDALAIYGIIGCAAQRSRAYQIEWVIFEMTPYMCFIAAGFIGLFVGTEYSDGTMRNKLAVGHTRAAVYGANLAVCSLAGVLFQLAMFIAMWTVGPLRMQTRLTVFDAAFYMFCALLVCVAFAAMFTAVAMCCANKAGATVAAFVIAFMMFFVSAQIDDRLQEPETIQNGPIVVTEDGKIMVDPTEVTDNPLYIPDGLVRDALGTINSMLPTGQGMSFAELYSRFKESSPTPAEHWYWPPCSLAFALLATAAGMAVYKRKDIK